MIFSKIITLEEVDSTNKYLQELLQSRAITHNEYCAVRGIEQLAGRGQKGNSWYAVSGESLTVSILLPRPNVALSKQYNISKYTAVCLYEAIAKYLSEEQRQALKIKWPNDIYYKDRKLAGILIEHNLEGKEIASSILGIGLNLNQDSFPEDLPNPISLKQITNQIYDVALFFEQLLACFEEHRDLLKVEYQETLASLYERRLFWREGLHTFEDKDGSFRASISEVLSNGELLLMKLDGSYCNYDVKDVRFKIEL